MSSRQRAGRKRTSESRRAGGDLTGAAGHTDGHRPADPKLAALQTAALDAAADAVVIADADGTILWVNEAFRHLTGYGPDEAVGRNARLLKSGQQFPAFYRDLWHTIRSGRPWRGELVNRRKDGTLYHEEMTITPVRGRGRRPGHFVAVKRDITDRMRRDQGETLLAHAAEHSIGLIFMVDLQGRFTYVNRALCRALQSTSEELIGTSFKRLLSPNISIKVQKEIAAGIFHDGGWAGESLVPPRDGADVPVELSVGPVKGPVGEVIGGVGYARDLSKEAAARAALRQSEEHFRELAEHIREVFFVTTPEPVRVVYLSPAYEEIWGGSRQDVYDRATAWIESIHPEDRERVFRVFARQNDEATEMEYRIVRPDGEVRWINNRAYPVRDTTGACYRVVGIAEDITARKRTEQLLEEGLASAKEAHEKLAATLRRAEAQAKDTALLTELIDIVQACPTVDEAYAVTGTMLAKFFPAQPGALCVTRPSRNVVEVVATWGDRALTAKTFAPDECWALRRGKLHVVRDANAATRCGHLNNGLAGGAICVPLAAHGETLGVLCVERPAEPGDAAAEGAQDDGDAGALRAATIAERLSLGLANVQLRETLRRQSIRDPLTGLFNRRFMEESLERELQRAARSREPVTLLMLDLDHFKRFNDTYGHPAGDALLRTLGRFLAQRVRGQDLACRYGGEEFLIILVGTSAEDAARRANAWRAECGELSVQRAGQTLGGVTFSVGVAAYPAHGGNRERLVAAADQALYRAKAEGRDRVVTAEPAPQHERDPLTPIT